MSGKLEDLAESYIEKKVIAFSKRRGYLYRKMQYIGRRKAADRFFFGQGGRLIMVEFKKWGEKPDEGQAREIARLRALGFEVHVIDNIADGMMLFA